MGSKEIGRRGDKERNSESEIAREREGHGRERRAKRDTRNENGE